MNVLRSIGLAGMVVLFASFALGRGMHGQNQTRNSPGQMGMMGGGMHGGQGMMSKMHGGQGMMGGMPGGMMQCGMMGANVPSVQTILRQSNQLNLSTEQRTQLQKVVLTVQKDLIDLKGDLQKQQLELRSVLIEDNLQEKQLEGILDAKTSAQVAIQKRQIQGFFEARDILTPEQQNNLVLLPMGGMMGGMNPMMQQSGPQSQQGMMPMMNPSGNGKDTN